MIKVWGRKSSSNVQCLLWCLEELGLRYERIDAGFKYGVVDTPEYLKMNPNGTVPTLIDTDKDDGTARFESAALLRYLQSAYGEGTLKPSTPTEQTTVDQWAEWAKINVALNFTAPVFWRVVRTAPSKQDPQAIAAAVDTLEHYLAMANARLARQPFLATDKLSIADIQFGHTLYRYYEIDIQRAALNNVEQYYRRLCQRPAYRNTVMTSYEELRVTD